MSAEFASARRKIRYNRKYFAQKWSNGRGQFSGGSVIELKSGRVITSIVRSDTPIALTVITANETIVLPKKEVDSLTPSKISMMPDDVVTQLKENELRDLIAYLQSPVQVTMKAAER
jgi:hypothetical protein